MLASAFTQMRAKANFVHQFIRNPRKMGSITPSSEALCRTMITSVKWPEALRIAELGAGDGVLTRQILAQMTPDAKLDAFEICTTLADKLTALEDPRMTVRTCSAEYLNGNYDVIFSGLPLLSLPPELREAILRAVYNALGPDGVFVQFQYTSLTQPDLSRYFTWERQRVLKNVPPAWVYRCTRHYAP
ncbi:methyltransferase [Pantoea agglomerans]|uniref:class I SAM-dependent methyltransferase n=1 Tax=unclassified Pantoea TaxID=2630326 RepID=UPI000BF04FB3|nr:MULTISPECIES: methyltransferase domain-containing protein [Pantoea]PEI02945.1 methyltransferase [Pantoea agglomerans]GME32332.1 methyltransferase [Pantoea sp. QMID3]GME32645.1 methyltransferase [Pantoea sp. QMID1]GME56553.1 methyltransferase [Pantoea sp. QMID4]GME57706.1 methyltransferase [Pantoea sp. QMID2]